MLGISQAHRILKLPGIFPVSIPDVLQSLFDRHIFASWIGSEVCLIEQREQLGGIAWVWNSVVIRPRANICSLGSSESIRPSLHDPSVHPTNSYPISHRNPKTKASSGLASNRLGFLGTACSIFFLPLRACAGCGRHLFACALAYTKTSLATYKIC